MAVVKINSKAIADVVDINGIAKASLSKFGGVDISAGVTDIFPQNNAAATSDDNTTTGWTGTLATAASVTDSYHGTYAIEGTSTTGADGSRIVFSVPCTNGKTYDVSIWAKRGATGTDQEMIVTGGTGAAWKTILTTSYAEHNWTIVATGTTLTITVYILNGSTGTGGESVLLDSITFIEQ